MKVDIEVTPQQICDMFIASVEGGSTYWCNGMVFSVSGKDASYQKAETFQTDNWAVRILPEESPNEASYHEITPEKLMKAFVADPVRMAALIDDSYDADDADALVQIAAFDDVVFG